MLATRSLSRYEVVVGTALPAEVFEHGDGHAVVIPRGLKLPDGQLTMREDGLRLVIEAVAVPLKATHPSNQALLDYLATLEPIDEEIGQVEDYPPQPVEL